MIPRGQQVDGRFKYLLFLYIDTIDQVFLLCLGRFPIWSILLRWASDGFGCTRSYGTSKKLHAQLLRRRRKWRRSNVVVLVIALVTFWGLVMGRSHHICICTSFMGYKVSYSNKTCLCRVPILFSVYLRTFPLSFFLKTWIIVSAKGFFCFNDFFKKPPMFPHLYW